MTREEEIKARMENGYIITTRTYIGPVDTLRIDLAEEDVRYLLSRNEELRGDLEWHKQELAEKINEIYWLADDKVDLRNANEELQRRVEKLERVADAAREHYKTAHRKQGMAQYICECPVCKSIAELDAKEQDDAAQSPELVPVYPGPNLKRGDIVYTPNGTMAEVYNISEDAGTFTSQGQFCASVLRREKKEQDDD